MPYCIIQLQLPCIAPLVKQLIVEMRLFGSPCTPVPTTQTFVFSNTFQDTFSYASEVRFLVPLDSGISPCTH